MDAIASVFGQFVNSFKQGNKNAQVGTRIMNGLVAVMQILLEVATAVFKILSQIIFPLITKIAGVASGVLGKLASLLVRFLANVSDVIVMFANWLTTNDRFQNGVNKLINTLKKIPAFLAPMMPFFKGVGNVLYNLLEIIIQLPKAFANLVQKITGSSIGDIFRILGETITGAVKAIANALSGFSKIDSSGVDDFTEDITPKLTPLQSLFMGLKNLFEGLWNVIKAVMPVVGAVFQLIGEGLNWIAGILKNSFGNESPFETVKKIFSIAFWTIAIDYLYQMLYVFKAFMNSFGMIFEGVGSYIDSKAMMQYSQAMKTFAIAILLIVASLVLLSSMKTEELTKALTVLTIIVSSMIVVMKIF